MMNGHFTITTGSLMYCESTRCQKTPIKTTLHAQSSLVIRNIQALISMLAWLGTLLLLHCLYLGITLTAGLQKSAD